MYGRHLAGLGSTVVQDADAEPAYASNELAYYAEMDDVQGSGIFDAPGSVKNIHPDAGIFADRFSLPGYDARERPFGFSEVRDVTTGRPIRVVPGGAVATDSAAQIAFLERGLYASPQPVVDAAKEGPSGFVSTVNVFQNPVPVGAMDDGDKKKLAAVAAVGAVVGLAWMMTRKKKGRRR